MGPFLNTSVEPENLNHQFRTMRNLYEEWQKLPEKIKKVIRPVEVYGVIIDNKGNQFLFMELVEGAKKRMLSVYEGKGTDDNKYRGFDVNHHQGLFKLIEEELKNHGKTPLTGIRIDSQGKKRTIYSLVNLEEVFKNLGVELRQLEGKDILWFDDMEGVRQYRIIDIGSFNIKINKIILSFF